MPRWRSPPPRPARTSSSRSRCVSAPPRARAMIDAAERAGVQLMVGTMKRYDPAYQRLLELLPELDDLRLVRVTTLESPFEPYVQHYPLVAPSGVPESVIAALREDDAQAARGRVAERRRGDPLLLPVDAPGQPGPRVQRAARRAGRAGCASLRRPLPSCRRHQHDVWRRASVTCRGSTCFPGLHATGRSSCSWLPTSA